MQQKVEVSVSRWRNLFINVGILHYLEKKFSKCKEIK